MPVRLGSEQLLRAGHLKGRRVGIVANPASIDTDYMSIVDRISALPEVTVVALFGPQHGYRADVQDNMIETAHGRDPNRQVPIYSLYSDTREPTADMLAGVDLMVVDLQDVGARIYTFIYTMAHCLRAAARHGVEVVVCDRPNPIGGTRVEGPVLVRGFESFVGEYPIPMRHGMTIGELARFVNDEFGIHADLGVATMSGWRRDMYHDETGLPWVMPSPNMPTLDTAIVYPGSVLFEGTAVSEGRGTTRPFEILGAPWIDGERFAERMNGLGLDGVHFRPVVFEPTFQKHVGRTCGGCQIHVTDRTRFRPVLTGVSLLAEFRRAAPQRFAWRQPPYQYEREKMPIDILAGSDALRVKIEAGANGRAIAASWDRPVKTFLERRQPYLLY